MVIGPGVSFKLHNAKGNSWTESLLCFLLSSFLRVLTTNWTAFYARPFDICRYTGLLYSLMPVNLKRSLQNSVLINLSQSE